MADQKIIDAKKRLKEFAHIWRSRAKEFRKAEAYYAAVHADKLAKKTLELCKELDKELVEDKLLDKVYADLQPFKTKAMAKAYLLDVANTPYISPYNPSVLAARRRLKQKT